MQFGRPIGEFQLIQLKLAKMEVARLNVENLVFRVLESSQAGKPMTLSEASAMKLYAAGAATEVALEAVQLFGGNGYMAEYEVEQLARDAKVLQIYAGTDEIQVGQIARVAARLSSIVPVEPPPCVWELPDPARRRPTTSSRSAATSNRERCSPRTGAGCSRCASTASLAWWSPDPRGIIPLDGFHVQPVVAARSATASRSASTPRSRRSCAAAPIPRRPHGWIDESFVAAYTPAARARAGRTASRRGATASSWAGSTACGIGGFFAGESMFHRVTNASKVACWATVELLRLDGATLFDVQWTTPHLRSLGAVDVARSEYLAVC